MVKSKFDLFLSDQVYICFLIFTCGHRLTFLHLAALYRTQRATIAFIFCFSRGVSI
jgi:hypothetical protein